MGTNNMQRDARISLECQYLWDKPKIGTVDIPVNLVHGVVVRNLSGKSSYDNDTWTVAFECMILSALAMHSFTGIVKTSYFLL